MSAEPATEAKNGVTLLRLGVGKEVIDLPEGATLADLLRLAMVSADGHEVYVDGRPLEECLVLKPGTIVSLVPRAGRAASEFDWRGVVGAFHGNPEFEAMMEQVQAEREAEKDRS
jgi:hypothetical protein